MLRLTLAIATLLQAVTCNPFWKHEKFISDLEKRYAEMDFTTRENQHEQMYVHLVAHTHDDVGWLKTVDQYYSGSDQKDQIVEVNLILTTVVEQLLIDPKRKFTYVEMKFFSMWYERQTEDLKEKVKMLIKEGRLGFVNAGWSMHDEACPHFEDMINNMLKGHQFLLKEFGYKPRVGWHIDPFGHSNANPRLFADMGLEAWIFARIDHADHEQREKDKAMNYLWRPFAKHFGNQKQIFTGVMRDHYGWPQGFGMDERTDAGAFVTNEKLDTFNADEKTKLLQKYINEMSTNYIGNQMLIPFGNDFSFANAKMCFQEMDRLISYFNEHNTANITLLYSTPNAYIDSLYKQNLTWPVKYDDMFPYSDNPHDYWSGYFTSRQAAKKQVRDGQANLHGSNFLYAQRVIQEDVTDKEIEKIIDVKEDMLDWMGVYQHHDAISGTAMQHVANNYVEKLSKVMNSNNEMYAWQLMKNMEKDLNLTIPLKHTFFNGIQNDTVADTPMGTYFKNDQEVLVVVHNPSGKVNKQFVEIQVPSSGYAVSVWCSKSKEFYDISSQSSFLRQFHRNNNGTSSTDYKLIVPYHLYPNQVGYIKLHKMCEEDKTKKMFQDDGLTNQLTSNISLEFIESDTAPLKFKFQKNYTNSTDGKVQTLEQIFGVNIGYYMSANGSDEYKNGSNDAGGAYLLKPARYHQFQYQYAQRTVKLLDYQHSPATDVHQWTFDFHNKNLSESGILKVSFSPYFSDLIQFDLELNGISIYDGWGKELTINWKFYDFEDGDTFWTDSNGLEMQRRIKDARYSFNLDLNGTQNISWNYYPINSAVAMRNMDKNGTKMRDVQVTIMNERSQAGSATLEKGMIELIHNRRLLNNDNRGNPDVLNETDSQGYGMKVNARYWLDIFDLDHDQSRQRELQNSIDKPLSLFFASLKSGQIKDNEPMSVPEFTSTDNLQDAYTSGLYDWDKFGRLVLFPLARNKILVRLENIADKFDSYTPDLEIDMEMFAYKFWKMANPQSSTNTTDKFVPKIFEVDLTANMLEKEVMEMKKKIQWKGVDDAEIAEKLHNDPELRSVYERDHTLDKMNAIKLVPQDMRSFVIYYAHWKEGDETVLMQ